ncbi:uncharacterized protein MELLADRAFT_93605 [Melampsora larici-populina 98AG31]|uniref:Uncharacterized protein n=1 Tax=Melampsora larici-populina (strain 98AG31 / pathotype 3-4-7) TaxID=747676 RepID=F4R9S8_MELLP|nr:uncharacterized protein MELLADRAFT_93605 [Melampsora larici-populina 98AG31]EGG10574.1 hypothetical protein MELLADRAFT_93605 [Melampsora larici-populina 98AG31]
MPQALRSSRTPLRPPKKSHETPENHHHNSSSSKRVHHTLSTNYGSNVNDNSKGSDDDDDNEGNQNNYEFPDGHSEDPFAEDDTSCDDPPPVDLLDQPCPHNTPRTASKYPGTFDAADFAMFEQITLEFAIHKEDITRVRRVFGEPKARTRELAVVCMVAEMIGHVRDLKALVQSGPSTATGRQTTTTPVTINCSKSDHWQSSDKLQTVIRARLLIYMIPSKTKSYNGNGTKRSKPVEYSLENRVMNYLCKHANEDFYLAQLPLDFFKGDVKSLQLALKLVKKLATYQHSKFWDNILTNLITKNSTQSGVVPRLKELIGQFVHSQNKLDHRSDNDIFAKTSLEDQQRFALICLVGLKYYHTSTVVTDCKSRNWPKLMWIWVDRMLVALKKYPKEGSDG